jgi:hypothetical protein
MTYRAVAITQRDGSELASSNCRMAAGATGIDYHTLGSITSSGSAMRSRQSDQSGGTDSSDLAEAWRSYGQSLGVVSSGTWANAEADLRGGRLVMIDVWHASAGGPCLSGSGAYGHTMAVAPEASGSRWLTSDPWCSPAAWQWWESSRLAAGAEEWGRRVSREATGGRGWAGLPAEVLAAIVRELMNRWHPDRPATGPDAETGGAKGGPILYTRSAVPGSSSSGGDEVRFANANGYGLESGLRVNVGEGSPWYYLDGAKGGTFSADAALPVMGLPDSEAGGYVVMIGTGSPYKDNVPRDTLVMIRTSNDTYPGPEPEPEPEPGPPDTDADAIRAERDAEWRDWLLAGSPGEPPA